MYWTKSMKQRDIGVFSHHMGEKQISSSEFVGEYRWKVEVAMMSTKVKERSGVWVKRVNLIDTESWVSREKNAARRVLLLSFIFMTKPEVIYSSPNQAPRADWPYGTVGGCLVGWSEQIWKVKERKKSSICLLQSTASWIDVNVSIWIWIV